MSNDKHVLDMDDDELLEYFYDNHYDDADPDLGFFFCDICGREFECAERDSDLGAIWEILPAEQVSTNAISELQKKRAQEEMLKADGREEKKEVQAKFDFKPVVYENILTVAWPHGFKKVIR